MKDDGQSYLFIRVLVKALKTVEVGGNHRFSNTCKLFYFLAKHDIFGDSCNTLLLYLLDLIWFLPTFGLFHYTKLPSFKRVR